MYTPGFSFKASWLTTAPYNDGAAVSLCLAEPAHLKELLFRIRQRMQGPVLGRVLLAPVSCRKRRQCGWRRLLTGVEVNIEWRALPT